MDCVTNEQKIGYKSENNAIDIAKFICAVLVVGIHAKPFEFNIWLDRGFGIITRLCVPFFFICGSYFFFIKKAELKSYLLRICSLYVIWSVIYLPFQFKNISCRNSWEWMKYFVGKFFFNGINEHLWFLPAVMVSMILTYGLLHICSPKVLLLLSVVILIMGLCLSTWKPIIGKFPGGGGSLYGELKRVGTRNGLFYGLPYTILGALLAKRNTKVNGRKKQYFIGFVLSMCGLVLESFVAIIILHTDETVIWLFTFPAVYFLFLLLVQSQIEMDRRKAYSLRKLSTFVYLAHYLFIYAFENVLSNFIKYFLILLCTVIVGQVILILSDKIKAFKILY